MPAFAITLGRGKTLRYVAQADAPAEHSKGWRPLIWTKDRMRADMFGTEADARDFARENMPTKDFGVAALPPVRLPNGGTPGGTPAAIVAVT